MKTRDLKGVSCIKDEGQIVSVKEEQIKESWKSYFDKLFNGNDMRDWSNLGNSLEDRNHIFLRRIRMTKVKNALRMMKMAKDVGLDEIPIEVWNTWVMWMYAG